MPNCRTSFTHPFSHLTWTRRRPVLRLLLILVLSLSCAISCSSYAHDNYASLIQDARQGHYEPALNMLRKQAATASLSKRYDHIVIAMWAAYPKESIAIYEQLPSQSDLPDYVLLSVAQAYRDQKSWENALALFETGRQRFPQQASFISGLMMTLSDAGQTEQAIAISKLALEEYSNNIEILNAAAYLYGQNKQIYEALFYADQAYQQAPQLAATQRAYVFALQQARLAESALRYATQHQAAFNNSQYRQLQADAAAELVRMAAQPSRQESERFLIADRALHRYENLLHEWQAYGIQAQADILRIRLDRLAAYHARVRMQDLVEEYQALERSGVIIPNYVLEAVADAYLYLRQPQLASSLYQQLRNSPLSEEEQFSLESGLYYAHLENDDMFTAQAWLQSTPTAHLPWKYYQGLEEQMPNEWFMSNRRLITKAVLDSGDSASALARYTKMVKQAPNNSGLRVELANTYRARLQARAAERELKIAETLTPRELAVENSQAYTALALQEWRQAELLSQDTLGRYPEHLDTQQLARAWQVHNLSELRVHTQYGISQHSPITDSGDFSVDSKLYTPPMAYNWRGFAGLGYASARFDGKPLQHRWYQAGAEWRARDLSAEAQLSSHHFGFGTKLGIGLRASYDIDDHWTLSTDISSLAASTPLRALQHNIRSRHNGAAIQWRAHEKRSISTRLDHYAFSDGNQRFNASLQASQRLHTTASHHIDGEFAVSAQRNSHKPLAPYYNPRRELSLLPGLRLNHRLYQHYETAWYQLLSLHAGTHYQHGYGTKPSVNLGYGMRYQRNQVLDMGFMINASRRPYDGIQEHELRFLLDLTYRF